MERLRFNEALVQLNDGTEKIAKEVNFFESSLKSAWLVNQHGELVNFEPIDKSNVRVTTFEKGFPPLLQTLNAKGEETSDHVRLTDPRGTLKHEATKAARKLGFSF